MRQDSEVEVASLKGKELRNVAQSESRMDLAAGAKAEARLSKCEFLVHKWGRKIGGLILNAGNKRARRRRRPPSLRERVEAATRRGFVQQWGVADPDTARRITAV